MVKKKGKSKRTTLQDKYKIQRRIVDTKRKRHKQAKRDTASGVIRHSNKSKKDPGIPNSWPFKQDLLQEIQRTCQRDLSTQKSIQEKRTAELRALRQHQQQGGTAKTVQELLEQAQQDQQAFAFKQQSSSSDGITTSANNDATTDDNNKKDNQAATRPAGQASRRAYLKELKKVVDTADILLQVLDARDPLGSRIHPSVESAILSKANKKLVLVLNKIDLVPRNVVRDWLQYLRRSHPTIAIKASNKSTAPDAVHDHDNDNGSTTAAASASTLSTTTPVGMEGLLQLLKNYARTSGPGGGADNKTTVVVGIIGYPNVGKSSIINALKRNRHAVGVSPKPGFTTSMQEVVLDRNIRLLDSPGVVFDDHSAFLGNCIDVASMDDPIPSISQLLKRCRLPTLLMLYNIPTFTPSDNVDMFLALIAKRHGRVLKGGIPDKIAAARSVLQDWNCGKIPYFTVPPTIDKTHIEQDAVVVSSFGKEFDLQAFDDAVLNDNDHDANVVTTTAAGTATGAAASKEMDVMDYLQLSNPTEQDVDEEKMTAGTLGGVSSQEAVDILMGKANSDDDDDDSDSNAMEEEEDDDDDDDDVEPSKARSRKQLAKAEDYDFSDL